MEGEFILFWDSDVLPMSNDFLKYMVEFMEANQEVRAIGCSFIHVDQKMRITSRLANIIDPPVVSRRASSIYLGLTLIRRKVIEDVGMFNKFLDVGEDTEFFMRVNEKYKVLWALFPCFHLKPQRLKIRDYVLGLIKSNFISNFIQRPRKIKKCLKELSKLYKLRILYYTFLPLYILMVVLFSAPPFKVVAFPINFLIAVFSLMPRLLFRIRDTGRYGVTRFFLFNLPTGILLAYGLVKELMFDLFRKRTHSSVC